MELNPTFLREVSESGTDRGSLGKSWHSLDNSEVVAKKFGWQWRYCADRGIWHYYDAVFYRYQWTRPKEWSAMRFIKFKDGQYYDCQDREWLSDADDVTQFEVVEGNSDVQHKIASGAINIPHQ